MLRFGIAHSTGCTVLGSAESLNLSMRYEAIQDSQGATSAFIISIQYLTSGQGPLQLMDRVSVPVDTPPVSSAGTHTQIALNHANDMNVCSLDWNLALQIESDNSSQNEYTLVVSGPVIPTWFLGEVDLDPQA